MLSPQQYFSYNYQASFLIRVHNLIWTPLFTLTLTGSSKFILINLLSYLVKEK